MQETWYSIDDGVFEVNGRVVDTEFPVAEAVQCADCVIVRLGDPQRLVGGENVIAYASDGSIRWRIQKSPHGPIDGSSYTAIDLDESGRLIARNFNGVIYEVNLTDGTVTHIDFQRFC